MVLAQVAINDQPKALLWSGAFAYGCSGIVDTPLVRRNDIIDALLNRVASVQASRSPAVPGRYLGICHL